MEGDGAITEGSEPVEIEVPKAIPSMADTRHAAARRASRDRLLRAAAALVAKHGTEVSLATIGEVAGMSRGAVNFFFATKNDLLVALASGEGDAAWPAVAPHQDDDFDRWLDRWALPMLRSRSRMRLTTMLTYEGLAGNAPIRAALAARRRDLREDVEDALDELRGAGRSGGGDSAALADLILSGVFGLLPDAWDRAALEGTLLEAYAELRRLLSTVAVT